MRAFWDISDCDVFLPLVLRYAHKTGLVVGAAEHQGHLRRVARRKLGHHRLSFPRGKRRAANVKIPICL